MRGRQRQRRRPADVVAASRRHSPRQLRLRPSQRHRFAGDERPRSLPTRSMMRLKLSKRPRRFAQVRLRPQKPLPLLSPRRQWQLRHPLPKSSGLRLLRQRQSSRCHRLVPFRRSRFRVPHPRPCGRRLLRVRQPRRLPHPCGRQRLRARLRQQLHQCVRLRHAQLRSHTHPW